MMNNATLAENCGGLLRKITKQAKLDFSHILRITEIYIAPFFTKKSYLSGRNIG
jgi:hypothetical protein